MSVRKDSGLKASFEALCSQMGMSTLFLIAALLCIPLCSRAHYSGVLSYFKKIKTTREDGTVDSLKVPLFTVDYNGSISVESMKNTPYYSWADECDNESKDGLLKCDEIVLFLSRFSSKDIRTNGKAVVYYQEVNERGVIVKNCSVLKKQDRSSGVSTEQCVLEFDDEGNLTTSIIYCAPGSRFEGSYTYNLATGRAKAVLDDGTVTLSRPMKQKNYDTARKTASIIMSQRETKFSQLRRFLKSGDLSLLAEIVFSWEFLLLFVFILLPGLKKLSKKMREKDERL